jgi:hypothetical protein
MFPLGFGWDLIPPCQAYHLHFQFCLLPSVNDTCYWTYSSICSYSTGFQDQPSLGKDQDEEFNEDFSLEIVHLM